MFIFNSESFYVLSDYGTGLFETVEKIIDICIKGKILLV